jgi:polysaccharide export outer membrane protein
MLQNPAMVQQLRQRLAASGMTADQIRARLRAMGYPDNLLDAYLSGNDSTAVPTSDVYSAVGQLGVVDSTDLALIRCGINPDTLPQDDMGSPLDSSGGSSPLDTRRPRRSRRDIANRCLGPQADTMVSLRAKILADSGYNIFGLDFFRHQTNQFQPNLNGPVDANYRLGPGDRLVLILTGDVEQAYSLDVTREGFIVIPQVGQVSVNNLTLSQLDDVLYDRLGKVYSGVRRGTGATTRFSVSPAKLRSNLIYVTGDVLQPGAYQISSAGTLLTALYAAGGPSDNGTLRDIQIRRDGKLAGTLDFYDYLLHGNTTSDVRLQNGDVVFVPVHKPRVRILGQIVHPAVYEIKPTETLADAIRFSGGFMADAARQRVQIQRIVPPAQRINGRDRVTTDIVSDAFATGDGPTIALQPGDVIRVFRITDPIHNQISVLGNVNMPGTQGLAPNMTVADALRIAGGVKPDTYLGRVLVTRVQPDSTVVQLHIALRDTTGAVVNDLQLQENDEIHVYSRSEFRPTRYVAINGAVVKGGQYPYREGMTVRDLVLMAGGLTQSAYLNNAKIARLPGDRSGARTATEFEIPLDSSYLFERGPHGEYSGPPGLPAPAGPAPDVMLQPYDNVLILRQPGWELQRTVAVEGEVRFPGRYTLLSKTERITDLLRRAGGLTNEGYAGGVKFFRAQNNIGRIGIDLPDVLRDSKYRDNLLLQNGDSLVIPHYSGLVLVQGAVNSAVGVSYVPGQDMNYYIRAAGGPSGKADLGRSYVTQPNGKVDAISHRFLIPDRVPKPGPGSVVTVPTKDPTDKGTDPIALTGAIAAALSSLVAITIAIARH